MLSRSFKIPLGFLITGVLWAWFSHPLIAGVANGLSLSPHAHEIFRSLNHFVFVGFTAVILYFQIKKQQRKLLSSEDQYRRLFDLNPGPMWIFNVDTLRFVKVNNAAVEQYGYSEGEFLSMTLKDIRPESEFDTFMNWVKALKPGLSKHGVSVHKKKCGTLLHASVVTYDLNFNGENCRLAMANNITDIMLKEDRIKAQNAALHEIAWINSHEVRKRLCSVMSLTALLKETSCEYEREEYIQMLQQCTNELDDVVKKTNSKVDSLKVH